MRNYKVIYSYKMTGIVYVKSINKATAKDIFNQVQDFGECETASNLRVKTITQTKNIC